jgi:hypothetical protein
MSVLKQIVAFCLGALFGLFIGYGALWGASGVFALVFDIIDAPAHLIAGWLYPVSNNNDANAVTRSLGCFVLLHLFSCALLGGFVSWGIAMLRSRITFTFDE